MSTIQLDATTTLAVSVKDRHASADWYARHLGFELLFHADEAGWSELRTTTAGMTLGLGGSESVTPGDTVPVFGVSDVDAARAALADAGVHCEGDVLTVEGMVKLATFHDPDGNVLMLAQTLQGAG